MAQRPYVKIEDINEGVNKNIEKATKRGASIARQRFLCSLTTPTSEKPIARRLYVEFEGINNPINGTRTQKGERIKDKKAES